MPVDAADRYRHESDRHDSPDMRDERGSAAAPELGLETAVANDHPAAAADKPTAAAADREVPAPAGGTGVEDEAPSACDTGTAALTLSLSVPPNAAHLTIASQSDTTGHPAVTPPPSGLSPAATPTGNPAIDGNSAQMKVNPSGEGESSGPSSLLVPQAVLPDRGDEAGVNAAQTPARAHPDPLSPPSPASLTQAPVDAPQPPPIVITAAGALTGSKADDEVATRAGGTGVADRSAYDEAAVLSFPLSMPLDAAKPTPASHSETSGPAGVGPAPTGPAAAAAPAESAFIDGSSAQAKVYVTSDGLSSRPPSLLVPQAVLLDSGEGAGVNAAQTLAGATGSDATGSETISAQLGHGTAQATKPTDAPSPQSPASLTEVPGDAAQPSPIAVAAAPDTDDAGGDDLAQGGDGFQAAAGGHAIATRASSADELLAAKPVATQVAVHVGKAAKAGLTRIEIELEPASLGKVEVRLDFGRDGRISALFVAETREALDALRADARTLERALSEAGVRADSANLDFSLREHGAGTGERFSDRSPGSWRRAAVAGADNLEAGATVGTEPPAPSPPGERRLDIRA